MKFLEHLLQEGLRKQKLRPVKGLNSREVETLMNLMAKALIAHYASEWKFDRDNLDGPEELISQGIMQHADGVLDTNYGVLYRAVEEEVRKFQ